VTFTSKIVLMGACLRDRSRGRVRPSTCFPRRRPQLFHREAGEHACVARLTPSGARTTLATK
jgi:hypothetical protein